VTESVIATRQQLLFFSVTHMPLLVPYAISRHRILTLKQDVEWNACLAQPRYTSARSRSRSGTVCAATKSYIAENITLARPRSSPAGGVGGRGQAAEGERGTADEGGEGVGGVGEEGRDRGGAVVVGDDELQGSATGASGRERPGRCGCKQRNEGPCRVTILTGGDGQQAPLPRVELSLVDHQLNEFQWCIVPTGSHYGSVSVLVLEEELIDDVTVCEGLDVGDGHLQLLVQTVIEERVHRPAQALRGEVFACRSFEGVQCC